jgi:hypothetical protein
MLFDRNENGLETHGDLQFERRRPPCVAQGGKAGDFSSFRARLVGERSAPRWLSSYHAKQPGKLDSEHPEIT